MVTQDESHEIWEAVKSLDQIAVTEDKMDKVELAVMYQAIQEDVLFSVIEKKTIKDAREAI